jgi:hypothetical protein
VIVVSDTSPVTNLAIVGRLSLLHELYGRLLVPESVAKEIREGEGKDLYPPFLSRTPWIEVRVVVDQHQVSQLQIELDQGEAEAIALCIEVGADLLLVDERTGRNMAATRGIKTVGLLGSLVACKEKGLVPSIKLILDDLREKAGFWVRQALYEEVLRSAGEG